MLWIKRYAKMVLLKGDVLGDIEETSFFSLLHLIKKEVGKKK